MVYCGVAIMGCGLVWGSNHGVWFSVGLAIMGCGLLWGSNHGVWFSVGSNHGVWFSVGSNHGVWFSVSLCATEASLQCGPHPLPHPLSD